MKQFLMGAQIIAMAAREAGAQGLFAYPITPASEIMQFWLKEKEKYPDLLFCQAEDEMSAGFMTIGAILAGKLIFTATAGPGNVLMQDAFSMAESMRVPTVAIIGQRGGPSTGTVVYSQQEVNLTAFGGNSEGYRIVYSPAGLQELYEYTKKAFQSAWRFRFPTFILTDGYTTKLRGEVEINESRKLLNLSKEKIKNSFFNANKFINYRNCYEQEEQIYELNLKLKSDFKKASPLLEEYKIYPKKSGEILIVAHGIVGLSAEMAINQSKRRDLVLFRPITLRPFPEKALYQIARKVKKIYIFESASNQILRLTKEALYGLDVPIIHIGKPGLGIYPEEIIKSI